jgi:hypothetical protein
VTVGDADAVRSALKHELQERGYAVAKDSAGANGELFIWGDGDRAAALFEFKETAEEACGTMYQGSWLATMPPRFAVLPAVEKQAQAVDFLQQAGLSVLFYDATEGRPTFVGLDSALDEIARRGQR